MSGAIRQRGAASLITVIIMSILILLIAVSATSLMIGELHQATDAENSVQAYYAAQTATEESELNIKNAVSSGAAITNTGCTTAPPATSAVASAITCLKISDRATQVRSVLANNDTAQYDLTNAVEANSLKTSTIQKIHLEWDSSPPGTGSFLNPVVPINLAPNQWSAQGIPPAMEVTIINYQYGRPAYEFNTGTVVLVPNCTALAGNGCPTPGISTSVPYNSGVWGAPATCTLIGGTQDSRACYSNVQCFSVASGAYRCMADLTNIAPIGQPGVPSTLLKTVVRLRPRYATGSAAFMLEAWDDKDPVNPVAIPLPYAQVDVTTKIGDSARRTITEVPVRSQPFPYQAIYGDTDVCKNFEIFTAPGYQQVNPLTCPLN